MMGEVKWEKVEILGKGSHGTVCKVKMSAPEKMKGRVLAVKSSKGEYSDFLKREGRILRSFIGCKEIVQCGGSQTCIEDGKLVCNLIMELAPYGSLEGLIKKRGVLSECEVRMYAIMLLKGLSVIHQRGIVHCDLKPDNILLFPSTQCGIDYQLKIADFGVSKTRDERLDLTPWTIRFRGTPNYMSPESVMGLIDTPLDIWSFGCILIKMITGFSVWNNISDIQDLTFKLAFLKQAPPLPSFLSLDCQDFLSRCFLKNPIQRWTATMLLNHPFLLAANDAPPSTLPMSTFAFSSCDRYFLSCLG
ncbi:hypothetical protein VNO77_21091 [Canavalia gladiata]|uniref:Protein kinase domain-containing protein n=1 Tax=Canavalia gladiata TaxID=3824 RepID=A0AAN9LTZ1_CANGL